MEVGRGSGAQAMTTDLAMPGRMVAVLIIAHMSPGIVTGVGSAVTGGLMITESLRGTDPPTKVAHRLMQAYSCFHQACAQTIMTACLLCSMYLLAEHVWSFTNLQASQHSQRSSRSPLIDRHRGKHSSDAARPR